MLTLLVSTLVLAAQPVQTLEASLAGSWKGTLEYRDYRGERRVTLPTTLVVTPLGNGALQYAYVYDDGPGKIVKSTERITVDVNAATYRVQNNDGYDATFAIAGLQDFGKTRTLVLSGKGTENDAPVELRVTLAATGSELTILRESKLAGGEWLFRNRYSFRR